MSTLSGQALLDALVGNDLADWQGFPDDLRARFRTGDFAAGLRLVNAIGEAAEEANHHPDLTLTYPHLDVTLISHDAGGVTSRDLSMTNPGIDEILPHDPWLGRKGIEVLIELWRGELPIDHPMVSPLEADLEGLGPLTLYCGTRDILWPDARLLVAKARKAGVEIEYHEQPGLVHVYPLTPSREGRAARREIVDALAGADAHQ